MCEKLSVLSATAYFSGKNDDRDLTYKQIGRRPGRATMCRSDRSQDKDAKDTVIRHRIGNSDAAISRPPGIKQT